MLSHIVTLTSLRVSCVQTLYKIWAKSNNPRLSYRRFSAFSCAILGSGSELAELSQGCVDTGHSFTKRGPDIGRSSQHYTFVSEFGYLAAFSNAGDSKLNDVSTGAKFRTLDPLWKLGEGWARFLYQLLKLYLQPNLRNVFDGRPLRGCWAWWIDKKKESSWVKLAFQTNVGCGLVIACQL